LVTLLKRALPAVTATAVLAFAPSALAATVSSGNPLTLNGAADTYQQWYLTDNSDDGALDVYLNSDPVDYTQTDLPANCHDWDSGNTDTSAYGQDVTNDTTGDGKAYILRCDPGTVTSVIANAGNVDSSIDASGLSATPVQENGGTGADFLGGSQTGDTITGGDGNDTVYGGNGDDTINTGAGFDYIEGGSDNDTIDAGADDDYVDGGDGDDVIHGGAGDDGLSTQNSCDGCGHSNGLYGGYGNDKIYGDDGRDTADGGPGDDEIHGGAGDDGFKADLDIIFFPVGQGGIPFTSQMGLSGGDGNDTIYGDDGIDVISGDYGSDTIDGGGQSDYIYEYEDNYGDPHDDTVVGGPGQDSIQWSGCDYSGDGASLSFTLDGQANDGLSYANDPDYNDNTNNYDVENVDLNDQFVLFPFYGCQGDAPATLTGDSNANVLSGGHGDDTIDGGAGPDRLEGEAGNDTFNSRDGYPDYVSCGDGVDSVVADQFDTLEACENADVANVRSAYDKDEPATVVVPPPVVFPVVGLPGDHVGPNTKLTTDTTITLAQLLNGVKLGVECVDEPCTVEGRLLSRELVGKSASSSVLRGFNTVLGRQSAGRKQGKRTITVKPCVKKSKRASAACRDRLKAAWKNKKSVTVKVQVTTRDKAGNRTRKTKLIKVSIPKTKANR
jgi:Ca2+-binding RTX toxin-like protein